MTSEISPVLAWRMHRHNRAGKYDPENEEFRGPITGSLGQHLQGRYLTFLQKEGGVGGNGHKPCEEIEETAIYQAETELTENG